MDTLERYGSGTLERDSCSTCGDTAVPVRVLDVEGTTALVEDRLQQQARAAIDLVSNVKPGDVLLVHAKVAIGRVEPEGAR